jgi:hypothetical protein
MLIIKTVTVLAIIGATYAAPGVMLPILALLVMSAAR